MSWSSRAEPPRRETPLATMGESMSADGSVTHVPHVVAWNLTRRCNLECGHCYISAGPSETSASELTTAECLRIIDEIVALNASPMFILSGGEPLLRDDLDAIASYAVEQGATVVVGTNGTLLTDDRIERLLAAGVTGVAVSVDSLNARYHDRFRRGHGSLQSTLDAVERLSNQQLDFVVQTTITSKNQHELRDLVRWSADRGAVSFNAYFLVPTGRGARMGDLTAERQEGVLAELVTLHQEYLGRMMVRAKCAPHFMRLVHQRVPDSPILQYRTRCPCGVQYCRITPDGKLTPCPYLPLSAGDLRAESFATVWRSSDLLGSLRDGTLSGRCGRCEYREICGGCRARAYGASGDYLAEDPGCSYEPDADLPVIRASVPAHYGDHVAPRLSWTPAARERVNRIPSFVRGVVVKRLEDYAVRMGQTEVTVEMMKEVRRSMPVDFSKRLPFFARDD